MMLFNSSLDPDGAERPRLHPMLKRAFPTFECPLWVADPDIPGILIGGR
jgi:hypothetical protein